MATHASGIVVLSMLLGSLVAQDVVCPLGRPPEALPVARIGARNVVPIASPPIRHSRPGAAATIFMDFRGGIVSGRQWNLDRGVASWDCRPYDRDGDLATFSDAEQEQIVRIWQQAAEDYAPFDVDVTTEPPASMGGRVVWVMLTGGPSIIPAVDRNGVALPHQNAGGVAVIGAFTSGALQFNSPAWVNATMNTEDVAEVVAHEVGHVFGLYHDGSNAGSMYYGVLYGNGIVPSWGTIMGTTYGATLSQWCKGEYFDANNTQDDLAIIAGQLGYVADDHGDTAATATPLAADASGAIAANGLIGRTGEVDCFRIAVTGSGTLNLAANGQRDITGRGGNLDLVLSLHDAGGILVATANPLLGTDASLSVAVVPGTYTVTVAPTAAGDPLTTTAIRTGYTIYGVLGRYTLSGTLPQGAVAPPTVATGSASGTVGSAFSYAVPITGANGVSATGLPAGLSIHPVTGEISGTPTTAGTFAASVTVTNAAGSASATITIVIGGAGTGSGLLAQYWTGQSRTFTGAPALSRTDATVDFDWGNGSPGAGVSSDAFTARWSGEVQAQFSETYSFITTSDDGVRLWINGQPLVDNWTDHGPTDNSGTIALVAGQKYAVLMEFFETGGGAVARLSWSSPSTPRQVIPASRLLPGATTPNQPPVASGQSLATAEDAVLAIILDATDPEGGALSYAVVAAPAHGALSGTAPNLTYTPAADWNGSDSFTFAASDGFAGSNTATVSIAVSAVNDAPILVAPVADQAATVGLPFSLVLPANTFSDRDGDALTWSASGLPAWLAFDAASRTFSGTPTATGTATVTVAVRDSANASVSDSFVITVGGAGDGLVLHWRFDDGSGSSAADASGRGNTGTLGGGATWSTGQQGGALLGNGSGGGVSRGSVAGLATGNAAHTIAAWVRVDALPANRAWIALLGTTAAGSHHWLIDRTGATQLGVWDGTQASPVLAVGGWHHLAMTYDGATLRGYLDGAAISSAAASFNLQGPALTVGMAQLGEDSFAGALDDLRIYTRALAAAEVATLAGGVVNQPPMATAQAVATAEDTPRAITLVGSDPEGAALVYAVSSQPAHGSLSGTAPNLTYTPAADWNGGDSFAFTVSDGQVVSAAATVGITVSAVNDAPQLVAALPARSATVGTPFSCTIPAGAFSDRDGDALTYTASGLPAWLAFDAAGRAFSGTPIAAGTATVTVTARDPAAATASGSFVITVSTSSTNLPPVISAADIVWMEDVLPAGAVIASEGDSWGNFVAASPVPFSGTAAWQSAILSGEHQLYFHDAPSQTVAAGERLFAYVHLDPAHPPSEVMLQWNSGTGSTYWNHRAYWGGNSIAWGDDGTASRRYMGPLPEAGRWVRLEVPAEAVGMAGESMHGMAFTLFDGRATWDRAGLARSPVVSAIQGTATPITLVAADADGDALTFRVVGAPAHGVLTGTPPAVVYTPTSGFAGEDLFTYIANDGHADSNLGTIVVSVAPAAIGSGLSASYWSDQLRTFSGTPALIRTDATVDFDWVNGAPATGITSDHFTVRWSGQVEAASTETYSFITSSDDGVRLWVDGRLLVDNWSDHSPTDNGGTISLVAGQRYPIVMEYYENGGGAIAKLSWSSSSIPRQIIPSARLFPGEAAAGQVPRAAGRAEASAGQGGAAGCGVGGAVGVLGLLLAMRLRRPVRAGRVEDR